VVLAGGIGSRFWPVSTPTRPKQLLPLASEQPLIVDTLHRARALAPDDRIRILAGQHLATSFATVLEKLPESSYWIEPQARGTCPVLTWAAWEIARLDPDAVMVSLHADHLIRPIAAFQDTLAASVEVARREGLLLSIGVEPDRVETGYGHVEPGEPLESVGEPEAFRVRAFHEKPDADTARRYMEQGYLWNTGIFVWKPSVLLEEVQRHAPEVFACLPLLENGPEPFFEDVPACVIDTAVMERSDRVGTVKATFSWDDVGSWEALSRTRQPDADGNVMLGHARAVDARDNIVFADDGEIVLFGTDGLVVVRAGDKTVVLPRDRAADLKTLLAGLEET